MILRFARVPRQQPARAFSLIELLVSTGLGSVLLTAVAALTMYGARSFAAMVNYVDLDVKSRNTLDMVTREMREMTALIAYQTNLPVKFIVLTNATEGKAMKLAYYSQTGTLVFEKTGEAAEVKLTNCDRWDFDLSNRVPILTSTNITFHDAVNGTGQLDPSFVKLINMSWTCSRPIRGVKANTETMQTAQIVLRNKME